MVQCRTHAISRCMPRTSVDERDLLVDLIDALSFLFSASVCARYHTLVLVSTVAAVAEPIVDAVSRVRQISSGSPAIAQIDQTTRRTSPHSLAYPHLRDT